MKKLFKKVTFTIFFFINLLTINVYAVKIDEDTIKANRGNETIKLSILTEELKSRR